MPAGLSVAQINITVSADTSDADGKLAATGDKVDSFAAKTNQATSTAANFGAASATMAAGAAGIALGLADSVMAAGDFQATVNEIGAVSGATASELEQLSAMALQVGKDTAFSAQEGAQAISELSKAGVTVPDILNGAAMATANLAAAAGVDMPRAAEIMSNAMNMFKISGSDSARVADVLAAAANTSAASVDELATGFSQAGPSAAALGLSLEDTAAALALFSDRGLSGSDAGTSLKTMLASLTPATNPAREAFRELGLTTDDVSNAFFDAQGNFVGMDKASDLLYGSLKDLTDQQRAQYLETIFGSDASRAAELMFQAQKSAAEGTGRGYDDYRAAVEASGQATDVANAKMAGMNGAIEALRGSIETAQIVIGTTFVGAIEFAADALSGIVNAFLNLPGPVQTAIAGVAAGAAAFLAVGSAIGFIIGPLGAFTAALVPMAAGILAIATPLALVTAAIAAFAIAYKTNFLGFGDAVDSVVAKVTTFASQFGQIFDMFSNGSDAASGLTQRIEGFGKAVEFMTGLPVAGFFSGIASALDEAGNHFASITGRISELMGAGFTPLQAAVRALREEFPAFSGAIATVGTLFQNLLNTVSGVAAGLMSAFDALRNGDLSGVFAGLLSAGQAAITGLLNSFQILGGGILQAFNAIDWSAISATLQVGLQNASTALQTWFGTISQNLQTWFTSIDWGVIGGMLSSGLQTAISAMGDVATLLLTKGAELISGLATGFAQAWPTVSAWLGTVPGLIGAGIAVTGDLTTLLVQKGVDLIGGLLTGFTQKWPEIASWLGNMAGLIGTAVTITTDLLLQKGIDLLAGLKAGIDQKWPEVDAWLAAMPQDIADTVGDLAQSLVAKGSDLMAGLKSGIDAKWPEVDSWLAALPQDIADTVGDLAQTLSDKGTELIQGLSTGAQDFWTGTVEPWLASVAELASTAVGDLTQAILAHGTELITGLSTGAQDFWTGTVEPWLVSIGSLALAAVGDLSSTLLAQGQAMLTGLYTGALDIWNNQLGPWLQSLPGMIVSAVGDLSQSLYSAGQNLIQGLINGIESMKTAAWNKMTELTDGLKNIPGAQFILGSPSKLFFRYGVWVIEGLINGFENQEGEAYATIRRIAENVGGRFADGLRKSKPEAVAAAKDLGDTIAETVQSRLGDIFDLVGLDSSQFSESGKKAGKDFTDAINETTGDPSDYEVGSAEWHQALQEKIAGSMGDIGREGGKRLKDGIEDATSDINLDDVAHDIAAIANIAGGELYGVQELFNNLNDVMGQTDVKSADAADALKLMQMQLASIGGDNTPEAIASLAAGFGELSREVADAGGHIDDDLRAKINDLSAQIPGALKEAGTAFGDFGSLAGDDIAKAMGVILEQIRNLMRELVDVMREAFGLAATEGTNAFADACYPGLKDAMAGGADVIQTGAKDWESALITTGEWAGQTIGEAMANGMSAKEADWLNQMGFVVDRAIKKGVEGGKKGGTIGEETVKQAGLGVSRKERDYQDRMTEMVTKGADAGKTAASQFTEVGAAAVDNTTRGMQSEQTDLLKTAETTVKAVVKVFGDNVQAMYDIGKNFMEGFALGMRAGAGEVEDAAYDIGKSAEKELRKATESQSPSRAAHRVGQDVTRGFADGMTSLEDLSRKAARRLWKAAWKELKDNIKEAGFLGSDWAVDFWQGMLNSPDMTGPLAAWITDQMVAAADTALKKTQALIAGIAAQLDIARGLVDAPSSIPEVPQPEAVDTSQKDLLQQQLDATRDLTDAITKAFESAFSAAHKAHIDFVQGTISEGDYLAKYQAAQEAFNAKNANARQAASLEAQVKTAQAAIDAETAARQKAYEQAVKDRDAAVAAEKRAREAAVAQLEQAQRDAQMQMTQDVINEANQRIAQYEKEIKKASDPRERAELKAKIALERERIDVANQLAGAITAANNATSDFDLAKANAQIEYFTAQLEALGQVDVGGMLQGIADAMLEAANKIAQAADKMKNAFGGGGGGGKNKGEKDKNGGTQDARDPSLSGGGGMDSVVQQFDKGGKAARKFGDDVSSGSGVAARAIDDLVKRGVISLDTLGAAGGRAGKKMTDGVATAVASGETHMTKQVDRSIEAATVNGQKIGHDRGRSIGVEITTGTEDGVTSRERNVTKTIDGVITNSAKEAEKSAKPSGQGMGTELIFWTSSAIDKGDRDVRRAAKGVMDGAGIEAKKDAHRLGNAAGDDLGRGMADGIRGRKGDVERAARELADAADKASRKKSESRSPSRVWMRHGHDMGDGLIIGLHDRKGDAEDAARALVYTPRGLPGGNSVNSNGSGGSGGKSGSGNTTVHIENVNLPNVVHPEDFWPAIENLLRTNGVSAGRG